MALVSPNLAGIMFIIFLSPLIHFVNEAHCLFPADVFLLHLTFNAPFYGCLDKNFKHFYIIFTENKISTTPHKDTVLLLCYFSYFMALQMEQNL